MRLPPDMSQPKTWLTFLLVGLCCSTWARGLSAEDGESFFESRIRPLLVDRCLECHGEKKQEGGLRLDSRTAWQAGGEHGSVIQIGSPEASRLIEAVRYSNADLQMPPTKKLAEREIMDLEAWVKMGEIYSSKNRTAEALACYQKAITLKIDEAELWNKMSEAYEKLEKFDKAAECTSKYQELLGLQEVTLK